MRLLAPARPYGNRLRNPTTIKIKGLNVVPRQTDIGAGHGGWSGMWGGNGQTYDWTGWIKAQIDLAVTNGANCVKVAGSGSTAAQYPVLATFLTRAQQFLDYCVSIGLYVYWNTSGLTEDIDAVGNAAIWALLDLYPNVIGVDVVNEVGMPGAPTVTDMTSLLAQARVNTRLPLGVSANCKQVSDLTNGTVQAICHADVDFMDFHPYYTSGDPANADWTAYRAAAYYKPWILGECGQELNLGATAQTNRWTALGTISGAATDCYGSVGFCIADYGGGGNQWGMYPANFSAVRTQISTPFAAWPSHA